VEFRQHKLDNGLEVIAECNPRAYATAVGFFVNAGSRDETDEISGVSHFLEHMAFKGTPKRSAADVNRELDEMGSHSNARTGEERTVYHATVLPEFQDQVVELLSDIMRPSLREDDFETEKQVIIEEIGMYDDQPPFGGYERCMAAHFGKHPLSRSVLGTAETVGNLTPEQMRAYFEQRYSPSNIALVAAGNVDFDRLVKVADQHCGSWTPFESRREIARAAAHQSFEVMHKEASSQEYVIQISDGPAAEDNDRFAGRVLVTVLGDDSGSRFYWELIETGAAEFAGMGTYEYQGTGTFMTFLGSTPEATPRNIETIQNIYRQVEREGVTESELAQAKNKIASHIILQSERTGNRLFAVGVNWLQRREYNTVRELADKYNAVTVADIAALLEKYQPSVNTTLAVGPLKELAQN